MRKIEGCIVTCMMESTPMVSKRDRVELVANMAIHRLHGSIVAMYGPTHVTLGVLDGRWQTATTKSRINAHAHTLGLPTIHQRNFTWRWSDGVEYNGPRVFQPL